ncbi:DMT family transporter [Pelagibacterium sp. H642]|uniref:DMT family transporter n=1 Tax=Pelagibacterium sp. H642 TaxID=1881069 RepID=UPI0028158B02|nr:DMT family transporter [Pelagibacterium sp. H642]WMT88999.1 DMT family transporter [Pelagibacterium sp. H642]
MADMHTMPPSPLRDQNIGLALAALGAALFATKGIFVKLAYAQGLDALTVLAWRMILAVPFFLAFGLLAYRDRRRGKGRHANEKVPPRSVFGAVLIGIMGYYGASLLDFLSLDLITAQLNRLVLLTYPFIVLVLGAVLFRRRLTAPVIGAALLAYLGIAIIFGHDMVIEGDTVLAGTALALASALAYALYQLFAKPLIDVLGPRLFTAIAMTAAGVMVLVHFFWTHPFSALAIAPDTFWILLALALAATVAPVLLIAAAIGSIGAERTAVFGNISPILTIILAIIVLGEPFTAIHGAGTALVICGILLFTRLTTQPAIASREEGPIS